MSTETDFEMEEFDSFIEYCPESPDDNEKFNDALPSADASNVRYMYVCMLCLRQYDLVQDLRGHMIEYHKYVPIERGDAVKNRIENESDSIEKEESLKTAEETVEKASTSIQTESESGPKEELEIKPVPFKDFRLILRRLMMIKCSEFKSCAYKFETPEKLEIHKKCHLKLGTSFKCSVCPLEFENWRKCSAHLWKSHKLDIDLLKCPVCEFKSHASALVWRHMRVHKKWRPRVLRSLRAVKQKSLQQTKLNGNRTKGEQSQPAPRKNKYYSEKTCEICGRKFVNGKTLSKHIKTVHNKIKPFICNVCGKKTARKASLIIHMRQHTGEKPLQCKSCKFSTRDPSVLHKHQMRHNREAVKLECAVCDYTCIQANAYKRHVRLNHPEDYSKIACDLCSFVTVSPEKLKAHKEDHSKGLIKKPEDALICSRKVLKNNEISTDCFLPLESIDSLPHEPAVDTGGVTIPAPPTEDSQFPTHF